MFCKNCGKYIKPGDKFCPECGASVADMMEESENNSMENSLDRSKQQPLAAETPSEKDNGSDMGSTRVVPDLSGMMTDEDIRDIEDEITDIPEIKYEDDGLGAFDFPDEDDIVSISDDLDLDEGNEEETSGEYGQNASELDAIQREKNKKMNIIIICVSVGVIIIIVIIALILSSTFGSDSEEESSLAEETTIEETTGEEETAAAYTQYTVDGEDEEDEAFEETEANNSATTTTKKKKKKATTAAPTTTTTTTPAPTTTTTTAAAAEQGNATAEGADGDVDEDA